MTGPPCNTDAVVVLRCNDSGKVTTFQWEQRIVGGRILNVVRFASGEIITRVSACEHQKAWVRQLYAAAFDADTPLDRTG